MHLEKVKRWQWVLIGLILGLVLGLVRSQYADEDLNSIGRSMNTQRVFENALVGVLPIPGRTERVFKYVSVVRVRDPQDAGRQIYVVKGKYCAVGAPGSASASEAGVTFRWLPYFYVAPMPYTPTTPIDSSKTPSKGLLDHVQKLVEVVGLKEPDPSGTVLEYMQRLRAVRPEFTFTYEWWRQPRVSVAIWMVGCVLLVGGIWPFIVSLVVYGTLFPPPEEKGIDLSKVRSTSSTPLKPKTTVSSQDMDQVRAMGDKLEEDLRGSGVALSSSSAPGAASTPQAAPIRQLTATAADGPKPIDQPAEEKHFEAKPDDFYPTQRPAKKKEGEE